MKVGDLVRSKNDAGDVGRSEPLGIITKLSTGFEPSLGPCWEVFYFDYRRNLPTWESELEALNESG